MTEGRETALRTALQVMQGHEIDTLDLLAIAEWLRNGKHPYDDQITVEPGPPVNTELVESLRKAHAEDELKRARSRAREAEEQVKVVRQRDELLAASRKLLDQYNVARLDVGAAIELAEAVERIEGEIG